MAIHDPADIRTVRRERMVNPADKKFDVVWHGQTTKVGAESKRWRGDLPADVVERMNRDLGPQPDDAYQFQEGT